MSWEGHDFRAWARLYNLRTTLKLTIRIRVCLQAYRKYRVIETRLQALHG